MRAAVQRLRDPLEELYARYNRRRYVHPDPLEFLYHYEDPADREVVGLVAASLAVGRVKTILRSVSAVLDRMTSHPARFIVDGSRQDLARRFSDFGHRFLTGENLGALLCGARSIIRRHGSLGAFFATKVTAADETVLPALGAFAEELSGGTGACGRMVSNPCGGSACKKLNLFLRWMVRSDAVDPGGWQGIPTSLLIVPLDTHMLRISSALGLTESRYPTRAAALKVTAAFRQIVPADPVKYDFALTRLGIRADTDLEGFLRRCGVPPS